MRDCRLGARQRAQQVDVDDPTNVGHRMAGAFGLSLDAGVVDEDIQPAPGRDCILDKLASGDLVSDVGLDQKMLGIGPAGTPEMRRVSSSTRSAAARDRA